MSYEKKDGASAAGSSPEPSFQKVSRVVVFGDSDWLLNANIHVYANRDLAMNAVNWLAGEEGGVSIRPGTMRASAAPLTVAQLRLIMALSFVVPEVMLLLGLFIWYRRRAISV